MMRAKPLASICSAFHVLAMRRGLSWTAKPLQLLELLRPAWLSAGWAVVRSPIDVARPLHAQVVVTNRCALACTGCDVSTMVHRPSNRDMTRGDYRRVLQSLSPRIVTLLGDGEPLLHPEIVGSVADTSAQGARPMLATNLAIGDAALFAELVAAGLDHVKVTLSHSNRERYRQIKGRDLFDTVINRVDLLRRAEASLPIALEFWVTRDKLGELCTHLELVRDLGLDSAVFLLEQPKGQLAGHGLDSAMMMQVAEAIGLASRLGLRTNLASLIGRAGKDSTAVSSSGRAACAFPWLRAYVNQEGRAGPCVDLVTKAANDSSVQLENLLADQGSFVGQAFRNIRLAFRRGEAPHPTCVGCRKGSLGALCGCVGPYRGKRKRDPIHELATDTRTVDAA
ncbi:MAG: hypothetical protein CMJ98_06750 [Planctomycetes bacterium]|nr:hypothetical protein [Planctomycetota bacterium]